MANIVLDFLHNYQTGERRETEPANSYQYDEGHVLEAVLPEVITSCEIHYWIRGMEEADAYTPTSITPNADNSCTVLGNIPNKYFETNGELRIYIVVTDGTASITTYEGKLHICQRSMPEDYVDDDPENEAVRVITEARAAATTATEKAGEAAESAQQAQEILDSIPEDYTELTEEVSNLKDDFHSYHSELGAGYADQLVSSIENEDSVPYNFRKVPYDATLEQVEGIVGVDVVVNQLAQNGNFADVSAWTFYDHTYTVSGNVCSLTANGNTIFFYQPITIPQGHKCLIVADLKSDVAVTSYFSEGITTFKANALTTAWNTFGTVFAKSTSSININFVRITDNFTGTINARNCMLFDLTQTFGSQIADYAYSLETATAGSGVAWLKKHFSKIFDAGYIAYNAGTMVHVSGLSAKKTVGFNQWDGSTKNAYASNTTGQFNYGNHRCTDYIPVLPNTAYYIATSQHNGQWGAWYDGNKNFISGISGYNAVWTSPANARYMACTLAYNSTTLPDFCVNLHWDGEKDGTYEPYTLHTYAFDPTVELRGVPKLKDGKLYYDGDEYLPDGTVNRRYILTNLGAQNWGSGTLGDVSFFTTDLGILKHVEYGQYANAICSKYVTSKTESGGVRAETFVDKSFIVWTNGAIYVKDSAYSDVESFKAGLSGVYLVAELATPTTETAEPYQQIQICDPNGTEEYISDTVAPVGHVTKYPLDVAGRLDNILTMPTANGTYVLRATVTNGKVTYSWVSA